MNFTDWQDLWLKKDVEKISKSVSSSKIFNVVSISELIIVALTLAVTEISSIDQAENQIAVYLIIILIILSIVAPIAIVLGFRIHKHCKIVNAIKKKDLNIKEYVDIFDNKICNSAMMADSLFEHMKAEKDFSTKYYIICEINYYINKCIGSLYAMKSMSSQIFIDDKGGCVSPKRLRLVVKLLNALRKQTYTEMKGISDKDIIIEEYICNEIKKYDDRIKDFVNQFNANNNNILEEWTGIRFSD
jgi:hypothetical protein